MGCQPIEKFPGNGLVVLFNHAHTFFAARFSQSFQVGTRLPEIDGRRLSANTGIESAEKRRPFRRGDFNRGDVLLLRNDPAPRLDDRTFGKCRSCVRLALLLSRTASGRRGKQRRKNQRAKKSHFPMMQGPNRRTSWTIVWHT